MSRKANGTVRHMVPPVVAEVSVEQQKPRRSKHGIVCDGCGSEKVRVERTQDLGRTYPAFIVSRGTKRVRRYCHCTACDKRWTVTSEITERLIK